LDLGANVENDLILYWLGKLAKQLQLLK